MITRVVPCVMLLFFVVVISVAQQNVQQTTNGECSPSVANVKGNVNVNCGVDPRTIKRLNDNLDAKDRKVKEQGRQIRDLQDRIHELEKDLASRDDIPGKKAGELVKAGKLAEATEELKKALVADEKELVRVAETHFELGQLYDLQHMPSEALLEFRAAYSYQPQNPQYANGYAKFLARHNNLAEAEKIFLAQLEYWHGQPISSPNQVRLARALTNLAINDHDRQEFTVAKQYYEKALEIRRQLAIENPTAGRMGLSAALNNLGTIFIDLDEIAKAETLFKEALELNRQGALVDENGYLPEVADNLNNLANLYASTQKFEQAEDLYKEVISICEVLIKKTERYDYKLSSTLNNLGIMFYRMQNYTRAEEPLERGLNIIRRLAHLDPVAYQPLLAQTLGNLCVVHTELQKFSTAEPECIEAVKIYRERRDSDPSDFASALDDLSALFKAEKQMSKAEQPAVESLGIIRQLQSQNPGKFSVRLAVAYERLGLIYWAEGKFGLKYPDAEEAYSKALRLRRALASNGNWSDVVSLTETLTSAAKVSVLNKHFYESKALLGEATDIQQQIILHDLSMRRRLIDALLDLMYVDYYISDYLGAQAEGSKALALLKQENLDDPGVREAMGETLVSLADLYRINQDSRKCEFAYEALNFAKDKTYNDAVKLAKSCN